MSSHLLSGVPALLDEALSEAPQNGSHFFGFGVPTAPCNTYRVRPPACSPSRCWLRRNRRLREKEKYHPSKSTPSGARAHHDPRDQERGLPVTLPGNRHFLLEHSAKCPSEQSRGQGIAHDGCGHAQLRPAGPLRHGSSRPAPLLLLSRLSALTRHAKRRPSGGRPVKADTTPSAGHGGVR